jgi:uncharacterized membrane protein YozB (DUF420 family)
MINYLKSPWTYYYLVIVLMFAALAYGHSSPPTEGSDSERLYFKILWLHFVLGAVTLLIGPIQFSEKVRRSSINRHRVLGVAYVSCVFISGMAGFWLAFNSQMPMFGYSLAVLDVVWIITTGTGLYFALKGKISSHALWMKRSFLTTNVFVLFRLFIPIALLATPKGENPEYQFAIAVQVALWGMLGIFEWRRVKAISTAA